MCGAARATCLVCLCALLPSILAGCPARPLTLATIFLRPTRDMRGTPADYGVDYDEVFVPISERRRVCIWHAKARDPKAVVVIIPGSDSNKSRYLISLPIFIPNGYDVILMDYEGFGDSTGGPLRLERLTDDAFAVVEFAQKRHKRIVLFGVSTGAPSAVRIAAELDVAAVILEAPLVLKDLAELWLRDRRIVIPPLWQIANLWIHPQVPDSFDTLRYIELVDEPKLIMHSVEDELVPHASGLRTYQAAPGPKALFKMRGGHGRMIELEPQLYADTIISWLSNLHSPAAPDAPAGR